MDVLILMAGRGSRFKDLHEDKPKPLVPLHGEALVRWVVENLHIEKDQRYIFVCLKEHVEQFELHKLFSSWKINFEIVIAPAVTEGAACSALLAKHLYSSNELLIANSDQFLLFDGPAFLKKARQYDGLIMSMNASGEKWSYIKVNDDDLVTEVREKKVISNTGTTGVYYFKQGSYFQRAAEAMIQANDRFNNEFYLAPGYNYLISQDKKVSHYNIGDVGTEMIGLGTAEDFLKFMNEPRSLEIKKKLFI